jgi:DNA repair protein RecN (Recombination protein N)
MLQSLYIKNYILIDELRLEFKPGFSVFTGETGAGKSILIDAIGLLMGDRFSSDLIRHDTDKSILEAVFLTNNHHVESILKEYGFERDSDELIITRELTRDGRSTNRLNNRSINVNVLKELSQYLIDIHSQNDTQYLLNNKYHLSLLDAYNPNIELMNEVKELYHNYDHLKKELSNKEKNEFNPDDLEFLEFQINEINQANLEVNEDIELESKQKIMMSFEKISTRLKSSLDLLDENDGVSVKLHDSLKQLHYIDEIDDIKRITEDIQELYYVLQDKIGELKITYSSLSYDEDVFNMLQDRLFLINRLKKKYGKSIELILNQKQLFIERINLIQNRQEILDELKLRVEASYTAFYNKALLLSDFRKNQAKSLKMAIVKEIQELYLDKAQFEIEFKEASASSFGIDSIEFLISMNPGESLKPLIKVASGGELSRLMLGMKVIFNQLQKIETVIFDEIDSGVSGRVATAIGQKMSRLSKSAQVFSVTHLGQVAACSHCHYYVSKNQTSSLTQTNINELDLAGRINELSMISSGTLNPASIKAAEELFKTNQALVDLL